MCNMHFFTVCLVFLGAVTIGSSTAIFDGLFGGLFQPNSGCTIQVIVPKNYGQPYGNYYKAEVFRDLNSKLAANQDRFNRKIRQVWVDAPDPSYCGYLSGGRCCLNGFYEPQYEWTIFKTGDLKKRANEQLYYQSSGLNYFKVYTDAPDDHCQRLFF